MKCNIIGPERITDLGDLTLQPYASISPALPLFVSIFHEYLYCAFKLKNVASNSRQEN